MNESHMQLYEKIKMLNKNIIEELAEHFVFT